MRAPRLPIAGTLVAAYRDWQRLTLPPRGIIVSAFLIVLAISVLADFVPNRLSEGQFSGSALDLVQDALEAFLLTPVLIAVHRYVILREPLPTYSLDVSGAAFRSFFGWLFVLKVVLGLPFTLLGILEALDYPLLATSVVFVISLVIVLAFALRVIVLWPAIAVGAPGAAPGRAFSDTNGQALRILCIYVLGLAPWLVVVVAATYLLRPGIRVAGSAPAIVELVIGGLVQTAILVLSAVIASHAFMVLADRVKRAAAV